MPPPRKGEPGYAEYRQEYNERRRRRLLDPDYKAKEVARQRASKARLKALRRAQQLEIPYDEAN
jgi:hypothetical protein